MKKILTNNGKILTDNGKILVANVESGGSATVTKQGGWVGTQVPNSGTVENVYFNTNLSIEETKSILETLTYETQDMNVILVKEDYSLILAIMTMDGEYGILDLITNNIYFVSADIDLGFVGWNANITYPLTINGTVVNEFEGIQVASENSLISSIFSTTPFEEKEGEVISLSGNYAETSLKITSDGIVDLNDLIFTDKKIPLKINCKNEELAQVNQIISGEISGEYTFNGTQIRDGLFCSCGNLEKINMPNVTQIGAYSFVSCHSLHELTIPSGVWYISTNSFWNCSGLETITVEDGNENYDSRENCNAIVGKDFSKLLLGCKNTTFPNTISSIGEYAFYGSEITSLLLKDNSNLEYIERNAFQNCMKLTKVELPTTISAIYAETFSGCNLTEISGLDNVLYIEERAFQGCPLSEVTLPKCSIIGDGAFGHNSSLVKLDLHAIRYIGKEAFRFCSNLKTLVIRNENEVCSLNGYYVFMNTSLSEIYVPDALVESYKAHSDWIGRASQIKPLSEYVEE